MYMIWFVLDDPGLLEDILNAWEEIGIHGATITESTGFNRVRRQWLPMRFNPENLQRVEEGHFTIYAIVKDYGTAEECLAATEQITGDLDKPNTGVFAAFPLEITKGVPGAASESG